MILADLIAGGSVALRGRRLLVELVYPRQTDRPNEIEVGLEDVRAADSLLISYDFDRDGYVIKQASCFDPGEDEDWQEVAFVKAWGRERR